MKPVHACLQVLSCLFLGYAPVPAQVPGDEIIGKWITEDGKYMIDLYKDLTKEPCSCTGNFA